MVEEVEGNRDNRNIVDGEKVQREQGRNRKTYAPIVRNNQNNKKVVENISHAKKNPFAHLEYNMEDDEM